MGVISIFIIIVSIILVLVVLVQNSKGGGLAANFSSSNQIMGVRKTTDFIEKLTWGLAISLLVLCLASSALIPNSVTVEKSKIEKEIENAQEATKLPDFTTTLPTVEKKADTKEEKKKD